MKQKFLKCEKCGNMVEVVKESGIPVICCGEAMKEIIPGIVEASKEKLNQIKKLKETYESLNTEECKLALKNKEEIKP